jgi:protein phosphatase
MNITIQKPFSVQEIENGFDDENYIALYNDPDTSGNRLFLLCDGIDNSKKGKIAASLTWESIQTYFRSFSDDEKGFNPFFIEKSIRYTEIRFDDYIRENPSAKGMAATFCLLYFSNEGICLSYAGDSRVYQFRNGKIIFKTDDHSLFNSMVRNGQILSEEAESHPMRSVVYRSIQGTKAPVDVDIIPIRDIQAGDLFLMCTNNLTKVFNDNELCEIFSKKNTSKDKLDNMKEYCAYETFSNCSAYIIPIKNTKKANIFKQIFTFFI